jgi:hypothetical protein
MSKLVRKYAVRAGHFVDADDFVLGGKSNGELDNSALSSLEKEHATHCLWAYCGTFPETVARVRDRCE